MNEILIYEPISLQTTHFSSIDLSSFSFFFFICSNVKTNKKLDFILFFALFGSFSYCFFLFASQKEVFNEWRRNISFAFCLSTLSFLSINFLNKKKSFFHPQQIKSPPKKTEQNYKWWKKALKELEVDSRSNDWHCEYIAVVVRIITTHHTVIMVVRIAPRRALEVPHPNAFPALARENMKKSKFPFRIHHRKTFRVRHITKQRINCTRFITALMARKPLQRGSIVATQRQVEEEVSQATTIIPCIRTFLASHKTRWCHPERAKRWARETSRRKLRGFGWKQKVSFFTSKLFKISIIWNHKQHYP